MDGGALDGICSSRGVCGGDGGRDGATPLFGASSGTWPTRGACFFAISATLPCFGEICILLLAPLTVLTGGRTCVDVEDLGRERETWLGVPDAREQHSDKRSVRRKFARLAQRRPARHDPGHPQARE